MKIYYSSHAPIPYDSFSWERVTKTMKLYLKMQMKISSHRS